jgi:hypothetical protein
LLKKPKITDLGEEIAIMEVERIAATEALRN